MSQTIKEDLAKEYYAKEAKIKDQEIEVYYKYWDGFQSVRKLRLKKDTKISQFLEFCKRDLTDDYPDMKNIKGEFG